MAGRPLKYIDAFKNLDDKDVYSPAKIARLHVDTLKNLSEDERKELLRRMRHTFSRFRKSHGFENTGDGTVELKGQSPVIAWFGYRWKEAAGIYDSSTKKS